MLNMNKFCDQPVFFDKYAINYSNNNSQSNYHRCSCSCFRLLFIFRKHFHRTVQTHDN